MAEPTLFPHPRPLRLVAALAAGGLCLVGCGSKAKPESEPAKVGPAVTARSTTTTSTAPTTTTTARTDPYAIPPRIDAAYAQRVIRALQALTAKAYESVRSNRGTLADAARQLGAVYSPESVGDIAQDLATQAATKFKSYTPIAPVAVKAVVSTGGRCVVASGSSGRRFPAVYVTLVPLVRANDPGHLNPTPWALRGISLQAGPQATPKEQLCAGT